MADKVLLLTILTQEQELLTKPVESLTVVTVQGEITVLPGHIPLFTKLSDGELVYRFTEGGEQFLGSFAVSGGFLDVGPTGEVTVLADHAIRSEDISEARAEEARRQAEEAMKNRQSDRDFRIAEASLRKALTELKIAEKRKGSGGPHI